MKEKPEKITMTPEEIETIYSVDQM